MLKMLKENCDPNVDQFIFLDCVFLSNTILHYNKKIWVWYEIVLYLTNINMIHVNIPDKHDNNFFILIEMA